MRKRNSAGAVGRRRLLGLAAAGLAGSLAAGPARALCGLYPPQSALEFRIEGAAGPRGWHRIAFLREGGGLLVLSEQERLGPQGRRLRQRVQETWEDGWLVGLAADTWRDGARRSLRAERLAALPERGEAASAHGGSLAGQAGRLRFNVAGYVIPTTFWHRDTPYAEALLSVVDGLVKLVRSSPLAAADLRLDDGRLARRGWELRGEWPCRLWYDESCGLVQAAQPDEAGGTLLFRRQG